MEYYGFSFPQAFLLGDPEWFERLGVQLSPDDFDPFDNGFNAIFDVLYDVVKGDWVEKNRGGCFMFNHDFPIFLQNLELADSFLETMKQFQTRRKIPFEPIVHASTRKGDLPLERNHLHVLHEELESCANIRAKSLVVHPPEVPQDVTVDLVELLCSSAFLNLLSNTEATLYFENGLNDEFFGSLQNILNFSYMLADKLKELGFEALISKIGLCFDTGHLLLWRYHHRDGTNRADKEIEISLPEYAAKTGVLHVKACDSGKEYITPFARDLPLLLKHSQKVMDWLNMIRNIRSAYPRFYCLEIPKRNFMINEIVDFRKKLD